MDYKYIAFLDVLGYKEMLQADLNSGQTDFLDRLRAAFDVVGEIDHGHFGIRSISDSIFITVHGDEPRHFLGLLALLKRIVIAFMEKGLLLRGGVAYERHYQNDRITYSVGLAEAYALEQTSALYPRIVIHNLIFEKAKNEDWEARVKESELVILDGAIHQLHVIDDGNWDRIRQYCEAIAKQQSIDQSRNTNVRSKHLWLQDYLFSFKPKGVRSSPYLKKFDRL